MDQTVRPVGREQVRHRPDVIALNKAHERLPKYIDEATTRVTELGRTLNTAITTMHSLSRARSGRGNKGGNYPSPNFHEEVNTIGRTLKAPIGNLQEDLRKIGEACLSFQKALRDANNKHVISEANLKKQYRISENLVEQLADAETAKEVRDNALEDCLLMKDNALAEAEKIHERYLLIMEELAIMDDKYEMACKAYNGASEKWAKEADFQKTANEKMRANLRAAETENEILTEELTIITEKLTELQVVVGQLTKTNGNKSARKTSGDDSDSSGRGSTLGSGASSIVDSNDNENSPQQLSYPSEVSPNSVIGRLIRHMSLGR